LLLVIILLFNCIFNINYSEAKMLNAFTKCYVGGKDGTSNYSNDSTNTTNDESTKNYVTSMYVPNNIEKSCRNTCKALEANDSISGNPLNDDFVLECRNICRQNKNYIYSAYKRSSFPGSIQSSQTDSSTNTVYNTSTQYTNIELYSQISLNFSSTTNTEEYFSTELTKSNVINIKLDSNYTNQIYGCGHKIITLEPTFPNMFTMAYSTTSGGNTGELSAKNNIDKTLPITTKVLLTNTNYAGVYDFNYDKCYKDYTDIFSNNDLETIASNLVNGNLSKCQDLPQSSIYSNLEQRKITFNDKIYGYKIVIGMQLVLNIIHVLHQMQLQ
jgi:hypothetical protein